MWFKSYFIRLFLSVCRYLSKWKWLISHNFLNVVRLIFVSRIIMYFTALQTRRRSSWDRNLLSRPRDKETSEIAKEFFPFCVSGPCGGKTTGQARLCTFFENMGWKVGMFRSVFHSALRITKGYITTLWKKGPMSFPSTWAYLFNRWFGLNKTPQTVQ